MAIFTGVQSSSEAGLGQLSLYPNTYPKLYPGMLPMTFLSSHSSFSPHLP